MSAPIIILCRPQLGENIGAVARIMSNFGLSDLRLVAPRDGWPNKAAYSLAAKGSYILDRLHVFESLEAATTDISLMYGTAAYDRYIAKEKKLTYEVDFKVDLSSTAFLFGCERSGLTNEELILCDYVVTIPTAETNPSLNLAQAVGILSYEYFVSNRSNLEKQPIERASKGEITKLFQFLHQSLHESNFFKSPSMEPTMMRNIGNMLIRMQLTSQDVRTLFGIFKTLKSGK